jgi:hypothetical protein
MSDLVDTSKIGGPPRNTVISSRQRRMIELNSPPIVFGEIALKRRTIQS